MTNLFVYGTLREEHGNHYILSDSKKIGDATIQAIRIGSITVVKGKGTVEGEVYQVDDETLSRVDRLEGWDPESQTSHIGYERETTTATLESGEEVEVDVYFVNK